MKLMSLFFVLVFALPVFANDFQIDTLTYPGRVKVLVDIDVNYGSSNGLDVLMVIDNSGSMQQHQNELAQQANLLVSTFARLNVDYHIGVVTTDEPGIVNKNFGKLTGSPLYVDNNTPMASQALYNNIMVGSKGGSIEQIFAPVMAALSEPLVSTTNKGFYRSEAKLYILAVTDTEDQSLESVGDFTKFIMNLKSSASEVLMDAFLAEDPGCRSESGYDIATKIRSAVQFLSGNSFNLCSVNTTETMQKLTDGIGKFARSGTPSKPSANVKRIPLPSAADLKTIDVRFGNQVITAGDMNSGWVYNSSTNEVILGDNVNWLIQPKGTELEVTYVPTAWQ